MKKKILTKHILMALTMAAMVPIGQAWAAEIDLGNGGNNQINLVTGEYDSGESSAGNLNDFTDGVITITKTPEANSQRDFAIVIPQMVLGFLMVMLPGIRTFMLLLQTVKEQKMQMDCTLWAWREKMLLLPSAIFPGIFRRPIPTASVS